MITEDYCSLEVAHLLKEKGFDEPCEVWYSEYISQFGGETCTSIEFDNHNRFEKDYKFLFRAPTHQMAMKWLRGKGFHITIDCIDVTETGLVFTIKIVDMKSFFEYRIDYDNTYEKAVEAGIKYCLENLI